ncbi:hypothetical protein TOPH_01126 [Tolypocladium ophioglossoides CBS 100239]|uniref:Uncharacterized protein n=1 Tax=Tolypocladium ophioglossoides (strain CBS 100239) TaxID=1163406 RepID=A0A0L0NK37_TOLOC|nr:hypothetical protein TOPH_01126 [Tolypocladium ophioglossoides CBS 100239]
MPRRECLGRCPEYHVQGSGARASQYGRKGPTDLPAIRSTTHLADRSKGRQEGLKQGVVALASMPIRTGMLQRMARCLTQQLDAAVAWHSGRTAEVVSRFGGGRSDARLTCGKSHRRSEGRVLDRRAKKSDGTPYTGCTLKKIAICGKTKGADVRVRRGRPRREANKQAGKDRWQRYVPTDDGDMFPRRNDELPWLVKIPASTRANECQELDGYRFAEQQVGLTPHSSAATGNTDARKRARQ